MARHRADPVAPTAVTIMWSDCSANGLPSSPAAGTPHKRQLHINAVMWCCTLLHTHQEHPHVHIVVKAEGLDASRLHIDKAMLREWRQDFARMMRDQGIAANATPRVVRGRSKGAERDGRYRTKRRRTSHALRE